MQASLITPRLAAPCPGILFHCDGPAPSVQPSTSRHVRMRLLEPIMFHESSLKRRRIQLQTNPVMQPRDKPV